ncbi:predicted lipoprotein [Candidatus Blochmanniella floridana]|uniref:Cell division coordinator CpoB n=1 Tax=Blochmanniella floridana TaxID=203907 RepID=Q7VR82_BLOFL|nr:predicted lipoprotein [Candidatus Blochmannia floridanus]
MNNTIKFLQFSVIILHFISLCYIKNYGWCEYIPVVYAKKIHSSDLEQKIKQLNQISTAHSQCLVQLQQQLLENQQDIDLLRGYMQDIQHHVSEIITDQKESYKKLHEKLNELCSSDVKSKDSQSIHLNTNITDNLIHKQSIQYDDIDYKKIVSLVLEKKQYNLAIQEFQNFIKNYPKSHYQPNAHYWLGQLYYNQGHKTNASYHFALVVKNYPKSIKAPDALLKIGIIMQETNQKDKAKTIYQQIGKLYPNNDAAKQAQKRLTNLK